MLNLKLADAYVELSLNRGRYDASLGAVLRQLRTIPNPIINIGLNTAGITARLATLSAALAALRGGPPINLSFNAAAANAQLAAIQARLTAIAAAAAGITIPAGGGGGGTGGGGFGGGGGIGGFGTGLLRGAFPGVAMGMNPAMIAGQLTAQGTIGSIKATLDTFGELETAFAQLAVITKGTSAQMDEFKATLMGISRNRPGVAVSDLTEISQIGARMGVADKGGMAGLATFTDQMARVKLVMQDIGTEELANRMGRVLNVFDLSTDHVAGFGSALTALDNVSTASSREILDITNRLSGTASAIGLTLPQTMALSATLRDVGMEVHVAGSAFSQVFRKMATDSKKFSKQIGMDAKAFADAYRRDPMEALGMVIKKLKEIPDTIAGQEFLVSLGFEGARVTGGLQQLMSQFDEVAKRAKLAASETGSEATLKRAESKLGPTQTAEFQRAANGLTALKDAVGENLSPMAKGAAAALGDVAAGLASIIQGSNRISFAGGKGGGIPVVAPKALDEKKDPHIKPATFEEAKAAEAAAHQKQVEAEIEATRKSREASQARDRAIEAMRNVGPGTVGEQAPWEGDNARLAKLVGPIPHAIGSALQDSTLTGSAPGMEEAMKISEQASAAQEAAAAAAAEALKATEALKVAAKDLAEAQKVEAKRQAGFASDNLVATAKNRIGAAFAVVQDTKKSLLGAGTRAAIGVAGNLVGDEKKKKEHTFSASLTGEQAGSGLFEAILNSGKKDSDAKETASNTKQTVSALNELLTIAKAGKDRAVQAVLGQ